MRPLQWLLVLAVLLGTREADAGKLGIGDGFCALPRSPWVPHPATPATRECDIDEDDDGLDDDVEGALAECFVPHILFAPTEPALLKELKFPGGTEPFTAFNAHPCGGTSCAPGRIRITYITLYADDAGYYGAFPEGQNANIHHGDSQSITVEVQLTGAGARLVAVDAGQAWDADKDGFDSVEVECDTVALWGGFYRKQDCYPPSQVHTLHVVGSHPVVVASWGKHHYYLNPPEGEWTYTRGQTMPFPAVWVTLWNHREWTSQLSGFAVVPKLRMNYPTPQHPERFANVGAITGSAPKGSKDDDGLCTTLKLDYQAVCACGTPFQSCPPPPEDPATCPALKAERDAACAPPAMGEETPQVNACRARSGQTAPSKFIGSIGALYSGESFLKTGAFCGGHGTDCDDEVASLPSVASGLSSATLDTDGDGAKNFEDPCPNHAPMSGGVHVDSDADGAGDECDPNKLRRDVFVGPGFDFLNAASYSTGPGFFTNWYNKGWLDTDGDGLLNGADACPSTPGVVIDTLENPNAWGESASFPSVGTAYHQSDPLYGVYKPTLKHFGFVTRGATCDPYEASSISEELTEPDDNRGDPCALFGQYGSPVVKVDVTPVRGVSANDPQIAKPGLSYLERLKLARTMSAPVLVDARRCGCPEWGAGDPQAAAKNAKCLHSITGSCPRRFPLEGFATNGRRWVPVERAGCVLGSFGSTYCDRVPSTARVPPPSVCPIAPATQCPPSDPSLDPKSFDATWWWEKELTTKSGHFPAEWFTQGPSPLEPGKMYYSAHPDLRFTFATRTYVNQTDSNGKPVDTDDRPLRHPGFPQRGRLLGNEADPNPEMDSLTGGPVSEEEGDERAGNLHTTFTGRFIQPVGQHIGLNVYQHIECRYMELPPDSHTWLWGNFPCIPLWKCLAGFGGRAVLTTLSAPATTAIVDLSVGAIQPVSLVTPAGTTLGGLDCLISGDCGGGGPRDQPALAAAQSGTAWRLARLQTDPADAAAYPSLVVVAGASSSDGDASDRVYVLTGASGGSFAKYSVAAAGGAPAGTASANALFPTDDGQYVVAFGEAISGGPAWLRRLELATLEWVEVPLGSAIAPRSGAAYALNDTALYRVGGADGSTVHGDVSAIDWRTGELLATGHSAGVFPARRDPLLAWDAQGRGLIYGGGVDAAGGTHADVWSLRVGVTAATRIVADDVSVPPIRRGSLVIASGATSSAAWLVAPALASDGIVSHDLRVAAGGAWAPADFRTLAVREPACPGGAEPSRCSTGAEWWREPGRSCNGGTCAPRAVETGAVTLELPGIGVRDFAIEGSSLWVARGKTLELWDLASAGQATKVDALDVGSPVGAVALGDDGVGVGTEAGFLRVAPVAGASAALEPVVDLCGAATDAISVGQGRWLVQTAAGAALLRPGPSGALEVATELFIETGPKGATVSPADGSPASKQKCASLEKAACGSLCSGLAGRRIAENGENAFLARDSMLIRFETSPAGQLALKDALSLTGLIRGVRATPGRAYVVVGDGQGKEIAVTLASAMTAAGTHDVGAWVHSAASDRFRARLRPSGRVEVAWVDR